MNHKRPPILAIILVLAVVAVGGYFIYSQMATKTNGALSASGTIEATQVNVAPELAGKVIDVLVDEGKTVKTGEPLLHLDPSLLTAQRQVAQTALDSANNALATAQSAYAVAQAQYDAAVTAARAQQGGSRLADWAQREPSQFDKPLWYFSRSEQIQATQSDLQRAGQALQQAQTDLETTIKDVKNADFVAAETRLSEARMDFLIADTVYNHAQLTGGNIDPNDITLTEKLPPYVPAYRVKIAIAKDLTGSSNDVVNAAQDARDAALTELNDAQKAYNALLSTDAAENVQKARAKVSVAQERYDVALDTLSGLQTGVYSPQVKIAEASLDQAKSALGQADGAVKQAQANLNLIDTQMTKLTIISPMDGVVLTRNVEPGEFVQPGATSFVLGQLNDLTITVYVPEDKYGEIKLGQKATVTVDSFPGVTFTATVTEISDKAEFTPRNVQTVEGRSSTVYAIKLSVTDPDGKLKIGMPADVVFQQSVAAE